MLVTGTAETGSYDAMGTAITHARVAVVFSELSIEEFKALVTDVAQKHQLELVEGIFRSNRAVKISSNDSIHDDCPMTGRKLL